MTAYYRHTTIDDYIFIVVALMAWLGKSRGTDEFARWWASLSEAEQKDVAFVVELLTQRGPTLEFPYSSSLTTSRHSHMRELRAQHRGRPYRVVYAFDPRRTAILLLGGDKTGDDRWYEVNVPKADATYDEYLAELKKEGLL